jgi:hypothetical protein
MAIVVRGGIQGHCDCPCFQHRIAPPLPPRETAANSQFCKVIDFIGAPGRNRLILEFQWVSGPKPKLLGHYKSIAYRAIPKPATPIRSPDNVRQLGSSSGLSKTKAAATLPGAAAEFGIEPISSVVATTVTLKQHHYHGRQCHGFLR